MKPQALLLLGLYRLAGHLLTPLAALKRLEPQRRGFLSPAEVWMHAASVGEAGVAAAIIRAIKRIRPRTRLLLTLHTRPGLKRAAELLKDVPGLELALAPYDLPRYARRAFGRVSPRVFVPVETELWPNLLEEARRRGVVTVLVNGRLSARSLRRYQRIKALMEHLLRGFYALGVIGPLEAKRFLQLGAEKEKVFLLGNAKYDLLRERARDLKPEKARKKLSSSTNWVVFGSVRRGEERMVSRAIRQLKDGSRALSFLVAPRHPESAPVFAESLRAEGLTPAFWTALERPADGVVILDEVGPLLETYALARVAFVGGSLVPKGGQNPLEPAAFRVPVLFGPHMDNFPYEAEKLVSNGGGRRVADAQDLAQKMDFWLRNDAERTRAGTNAYQVLEEFSQAAENYAELVIRALNRLPL